MAKKNDGFQKLTIFPCFFPVIAEDEM